MRLILPIVLSLLVQVPAVFFRAPPGIGVVYSGVWNGPGTLAVGLALALLGPLVLLAARRFPGPVVAITAAAGGADLLLFSNSDHPPYLALAFAIVSAVVRGARIWAWISVGTAWILALAISLAIGLDVSPPRIAAVTLGILIALGVGEGMRTRREQYAEISRRVAERKQSEVQAERVRIARELHDVPEPDLSRLTGLAASIAAQGVTVDVRNTIKIAPRAGARLALYRIAQESLTNVLRHAKATAVTLIAREEEGDYLLEVTDNGTGTPPHQDTGGRGLLGMHERAELLGGGLTAAPLAGGGFRVSARIPHGAAAGSSVNVPVVPTADAPDSGLPCLSPKDTP